MSITTQIKRKIVNFEPNPAFTIKNIKKTIINSLVRKYSIMKHYNLIQALSDDQYQELSLKTNIPYVLLIILLKRFFRDLQNFNKFFEHCKIKHDPEKIHKKVRIYLHKIYRLAPVFDYNRARKNLEAFHILCSRANFWPQISTQLALIIYITDNLDDKIPKYEKILQKNIRAVCNCSAYAFHRTRKKLHIDRIIHKDLS
jgi:hypothetical protein